MTYGPHALCEFTGGWLYSDASSESWAFGVRVAKGATPFAFVDDCADWLNTNGPILKAWFANATTRMNNQAVLKTIKLNNIGPDGRYRDPVTHSYDAVSQVGGASGSLPIMVTSAVSWSTTLSRGRARHGRIYPPFALGLTGAGATMTASDQNYFLNAGKALLDKLHATSPANTVALTPVICSKLDGTTNVIQGVYVDARMDTQRRRSKQVSGVRLVTPWP